VSRTGCERIGAEPASGVSGEWRRRAAVHGGPRERRQYPGALQCEAVDDEIRTLGVSHSDERRPQAIVVLLWSEAKASRTWRLVPGALSLSCPARSAATRPGTPHLLRDPGTLQTALPSAAMVLGLASREARTPEEEVARKSLMALALACESAC
jgi:hypothetical protein